MELIISVSRRLIIEIKRKNARGNCVTGSETLIYLLFKFEHRGLFDASCVSCYSIDLLLWARNVRNLHLSLMFFFSEDFFHDQVTDLSKF